ncbi:MAG: DUF3604 domain-containing protein, partial [Proteobacteria bacterium]|nr:DUF3604 domain-containing protein [Pseudomonadota bacterium]
MKKLRRRLLIAAISLALSLAGYSLPASAAPPAVTSPASAAPTAQASDLPPPNPDNNAYFGDVHVHTGWSFDGFTNGSKTTPMDAYAWAQGKAITGSGGPEMQIKT